MESMGDIIRRRIKLGITQRLLGETIGMPGSQLSTLESGYNSPREETLRRLSAGLDTIESNHIAMKNGAIVINEIDFRNAAFNAILTKLNSGLWEFAEYNDNELKSMAHILVTAVYEGITKAED